MLQKETSKFCIQKNSEPSFEYLIQLHLKVVFLVFPSQITGIYMEISSQFKINNGHCQIEEEKQ